jgi:hypothetical protein
MSQEAWKPMRYVSKALVIAGLLAVCMLSSTIRADEAMIGSFKLTHPTRWRGEVLQAGDYTFKMTRKQSDVRLLRVSGPKRTLDVLVFAQSACETCRKGKLTIAVNGENQVVTSLELPGYHVDFNSSWSKAEREEQARKSPASEQIAVQVNQN